MPFDLKLPKWANLENALKFALGTGLSFGITITFVFIFTSIFGIEPGISTIIVRIVQIFFNFFYSGKVLFRAKTDTETLVKYLIVLFSVEFLNIIIIKFLIAKLEIFYLFPIAFTLLFTVILKLNLYGTLVFKKRH